MSKFFWYDVITPEPQISSEFYRNVMEWTTEVMPMPEGLYTVFSANGVGVTGLMAPPAGALRDFPNAVWTGYIWVEDVDATAARIVAGGGSIRRGAWGVPTVGRMAVVADPGGVVFMIMHPMEPATARPEVQPGTPGHVGWHELLSSDAVRDLQFYADLFDWRKVDEFDMGEMGIYHMFGRDDIAVGGMLTVKHDPEALRWLYYFNVATIDAAVERVYQNGGTISLEPREVPGGSWIAQCADAQGGVFGMAAPAR